MKPNKRNIRKWVKALRSGKFRQTTGRLREKYGYYCCLGVACEVAKADGVISRYEGSDGFLPIDVSKWLGIPDSDPVLGGEGRLTLPATCWNDLHHCSFDRIAELIETTYFRPRKARKEVTA